MEACPHYIFSAIRRIALIPPTPPRSGPTPMANIHIDSQVDLQ